MEGQTGLRSYLIQGTTIWQHGIDRSGIRKRKYLGWSIVLYIHSSPGLDAQKVSVGGCHDPPANFYFPPSSHAGPSAAPAAPAHPAPVAPVYQAPASHHVAYQSPPRESMPPLYHSTTYHPTEPLDYVMEDAEPRAASPRDMDMQGPYVPSTPSPATLLPGESDGLPFHPKYTDPLGLENMSPTNL